jgi:molecular chaperone DnaK (HSP70)
VIGKAGVALGGRDIDRWIAAHLCPDGPADGALLQLAERIKCQLSEAPEARQIQATAGSFQELTLSRPAFERLLEERGLPQLLDGLLEAVLAAARREGLGLGDIDAVLPVGGSSRIPLIRRWLESRCPGVPLRGERPVEAVALGALALTPGVQVRDVLARGVSLRCWDRRSAAHRWHPLFVAGQSWPTEQPLELVLACSRDGQEELELVLGEPLPEERAEVVFEAGLPVLRERPAGAAPVRPWSPSPLTIPLASPGQRGVDRLRLRFSIDAQARLLVAWDDLEALAEGGRREPLPLGPVR